MKKIFTVIAVTLFIATNANALLVSVQGHGELSAEGMNLTVTEGGIDMLSGNYVMELNGTVLSQSGSLEVTITRSEIGITDEFCCGQCATGNGELTQSISFSTSGPQTWFLHYSPAANSDVTITYVFSDGVESQTLTVHYIHESQDIPNIPAEQSADVYTIDGTKVGNARVSELPAGLFIHGNNKYLKTK